MSRAVFNIFVEPQYTILSHGSGQPELQIFVGFNTQFVRKWQRLQAMSMYPKDMSFTSESATKGHPGRFCDPISDTVLDECLKRDPMSRVACETCGTGKFLGSRFGSNHVDYPGSQKSLEYFAGVDFTFGGKEEECNGERETAR